MPRLPRATYRVQLHPGFGFEAVSDLVAYLAALGVSHLYCSPYLQATPGSTHGYDVVDPSKVNEELGGAAGHARLCQALRDHDVGQLVDVVPNHMAITRDNPWWWDVLENGPSSQYASYFDVDWGPPERQRQDKILLPILGDHYGRILEAGELRLARDGGIFTLWYHDHAFPVSPVSLAPLLERASDRCRSDRLGFIADALAWLPVFGTGVRDSDRRHRDKEVLREELGRLLQEAPQASTAVDAIVGEINADVDALDEIIQRQHYRLAFWRTAGHELGYRRFFDVNTLIGLRVEEERVFRDHHTRLLQWVGDQTVDGLRIDHPDGLRDPGAYFHQLRAAAPDAWILGEKILEPSERLHEAWPIAGTTGYDFLNRVGGLFVDPHGEEALTRLYMDFTGETAAYAALRREKKHQILHELLGSDVNRLTDLLCVVCARHRRHRDYTREELLEAVKEVVACFPVYRTYVREGDEAVRDEDVRYVTDAVEAAKAHRPELAPDLLAFLGDVLLLRHRGEVEGEFAMRFQQVTAAAMAKGAEDTAFYGFNRFIALNEVGGAPDHFGVAVETFHRWAAEIQRRWPQTLLTTSTHDTKRSEDVRTRLALLSEMPERWGEAVRRWSAMTERYRQGGWPDRNTEYLLYQTLVGAWPIGSDRMLAYLEKAAREAKVHTSWIRPDETYERALLCFAEAILGDRHFVADLESFVESIVEPGRLNSLAQTLIKLTAPGVADFYQGAELWDLSLVDPDNRRPVDYARRRRLLAEVEGMAPEAVLHRSEEGMPKLWVIRQGLRLRRTWPEVFGPQSDYQPFTARGSRARHVVAFARGGAAVVTVVPRLVIGLGGDWGETEMDLPEGQWHNELTGETFGGGAVRLAELLSRFPVGLLSRVMEGGSTSVS